MTKRVGHGRYEVPKIYISDRLDARGWKQKDLATALGVGEGTVSKKLGKPERIDLEWLGAISSALNLEPTELFKPLSGHGKAQNLRADKLRELMAVASKMSDQQLEAFVTLHAQPTPAPTEE